MNDELLKKIDLRQRKDHANFWKLWTIIGCILFGFGIVATGVVVCQDLDRIVVAHPTLHYRYDVEYELKPNCTGNGTYYWKTTEILYIADGRNVTMECFVQNPNYTAKRVEIPFIETTYSYPDTTLSFCIVSFYIALILTVNAALCRIGIVYFNKKYDIR